MRKLSLKSIEHLPRETKHELSLLLHELKYRWSVNARDKQRLPKGDWDTWLILAGRGFGKTRTGAETIRQWKEDNAIIHLIGATAGDVRDTMVEGESGILACSPSHDYPKYEPSKRRITWKNGSKAILFSADEPDRLRGPQCHKAWADELAAWRYEDAWDQLQFGLRLGTNPQCVVTTTPRPTEIIRNLHKDKRTHVTTGTSYENQDNLAEAFFRTIMKKYEGTTIGRQELMAEILEDVEGALWKLAMIKRVKKAPELRRIVIPIDPATTSKATSDETGIIPVGIGFDGNGYVLDDKTGIYTPNGWAKQSIDLYHDLKADRIVGEANNGGDMIETVIRNLDKKVSYKKVWASRGKMTRAEPVASLYEQGKIYHVGNLSKLETEMTTWAAMAGEKSPNRVDSLVWGITELMLKEEKKALIVV